MQLIGKDKLFRLSIKLFLCLGVGGRRSLFTYYYFCKKIQIDTLRAAERLGHYNYCLLYFSLHLHVAVFAAGFINPRISTSEISRFHQ